MGWNSNFSSLLAITMKAIEPDMADTYTSKQAFLAMLASKGFKRTLPGTPTIIHPLDTVANSTVKSYADFDSIDLTPQDPFTAAEFNWKQIAGSASIAGIQEFQNSGSKVQVKNFLKALVKNLEQSFKNAINLMMFADGTGNSSKDIGGLALLVDAGLNNTVGGINSSTYSGWRNNYTNVGGPASVNLLDNMLDMKLTCRRGTEGTDIILTDQATRASYEKLAKSLQYITTADKAMLDLGFKNVSYDDIPIVYDSDCTAGYMYFLSSDSFYWNVGEGHDMTMSPFLTPDNQDAKSAKLILYGNLTVGNRARQGLLYGITNP